MTVYESTMYEMTMHEELLNCWLKTQKSSHSSWTNIDVTVFLISFEATSKNHHEYTNQGFIDT